MPPNANFTSLRQRRIQEKDEDQDEYVNDPTFRRMDTIKELRGNEIAIDGIVYDLTDFRHPGGNSIKIFGGNDVTVQYKMIHPSHTSKHLEKMKKIGTVATYKREYSFGSEFEKEVKREVFKIIHPSRAFGTPWYFIRVIFYLSLMFSLQYMWVKYGSALTLAIALGISQALIGLNVQHDANHGACSKMPWVNDLLGFGADLIGGCKWNWMSQHWTHHAYCNHNEMDPDSFSAEPMFTWNDYPAGDARRKPHHRFQGIYFLPMLSFYWLSEVFNPQILDLRQRGASSIGIKLDNDFIKSRRKFAIAIRAAYIYMNIVTPFFFHTPLKALSHVLLLGAVESMTLGTLFSLSHNFENSDRDPIEQFRKTGKPVCWYKAQVETSSTYGGLIAGCLTGGLNFQVEHHLFPRMSSAYYPFIAPTVRKVCEKHGIKYAYYPYVWQNLASTIKYMHRAGNGLNWEHFEDAMRPLSGRN